MTPEAWSTLVVSVLVPLVLRIVAHFWPWLADDADTPPRHGRGAPDDA